MWHLAQTKAASLVKVGWRDWSTVICVSGYREAWDTCLEADGAWAAIQEVTEPVAPQEVISDLKVVVSIVLKVEGGY